MTISVPSISQWHLICLVQAFGKPGFFMCNCSSMVWFCCWQISISETDQREHLISSTIANKKKSTQVTGLV